MTKRNVSTDINALRRAARSATPLMDCSARVFWLYREWRCGALIGLDSEEQAAFMMLIAEVLENPQ